MSQFMLCESHGDLSNLSCIPLLSISVNKNFINKIALENFKGQNLENIWVMENIDFYCMEARNALSKGINFKMTKLYELLSNIYCRCDKLVMWYWDEYQELDFITSIDDFVFSLEISIKDSTCEIYLKAEK